MSLSDLKNAHHAWRAQVAADRALHDAARKAVFDARVKAVQDTYMPIVIKAIDDARCDHADHVDITWMLPDDFEPIQAMLASAGIKFTIVHHEHGLCTPKVIRMLSGA